MHILLADDALDTRSLYALAFRMEGHTVRLAINGAEAIAAVEQEVFDVILLDLHMPVIDGWEALRRIRQSPHGARVPIALFSAFVNHNEIPTARARGATTVFLKPILPNAMLMQLHELIARFQHEERNKMARTEPGADSSC